MQITLLQDWLFNVLDYIDIHGLRKSITAAAAAIAPDTAVGATVHDACYCTATILLLCYCTTAAVLPKAMHCATVPATHFNTKVTSDVT